MIPGENRATRVLSGHSLDPQAAQLLWQEIAMEQDVLLQELSVNNPSA